jgi:hypothetical protein
LSLGCSLCRPRALGLLSCSLLLLMLLLTSDSAVQIRYNLRLTH